jgi:hypothetical protein
LKFSDALNYFSDPFIEQLNFLMALADPSFITNICLVSDEFIKIASLIHFQSDWLDGAMIVLALSISNFLHPGWLLSNSAGW